MSTMPGQAEWNNLANLLPAAVAEDFGDGDVTAALLPATLRATGRFVARHEQVVCGAALLDRIAAAYDERIATEVACAEGDRVSAGATLATWTGPARAIVSAERVALNFLQRLGGMATMTRQYVDAVAGTGAAILDTRKTLPGWRDLSKYAVRVGGGTNHRRGLHDAILVKDNHLAALAVAGVAEPLPELARRWSETRGNLGEGGFVEVEVDTLDQLAVAMCLPLDIILLDNMAPDTLRQAVALRDGIVPDRRVQLEASGGITLETIRAVAETGVERISVGALTHSAPAVDIALDFTWSAD